jgi:uncharacterized membrane protein
VRAVGNRWATARIEGFSDGVLAIAITLLVLDIRMPQSAYADLWSGIAHQWPAYLAYATSFITVGGIWLAHHGIFQRLHHADDQVIRLNLLLLMMVSFLPFPTRLVAEAIRDTSAERAAVIFYGGTLLVISLLLGSIWGTVARRRELLKPDVSEHEVSVLLKVTTPNVGFYVVVTLLAIVAPKVAAFGYLVIAIAVVLRAHGDHKLRPPASARSR